MLTYGGVFSLEVKWLAVSTAAINTCLPRGLCLDPSTVLRHHMGDCLHSQQPDIQTLSFSVWVFMGTESCFLCTTAYKGLPQQWMQPAIIFSHPYLLPEQCIEIPCCLLISNKTCSWSAVPSPCMGQLGLHFRTHRTARLVLGVLVPRMDIIFVSPHQ